jgi:hypothetical protein
LKSLRSVNLSGTKITAAGKAAWQRKEAQTQD